MINIERQQGLLLALSNKLRKKINVYAIGGTAMLFLGLKDVTADIDLVFESRNDKEIFKEAIESIGYKKMDAVIVYGRKENMPEMFMLGDERFDLFVKEVISFIFSESMQKRAKQIHQFGDNLMLKIADPHDIILMKCATDRIKDMDDAINIIKNTNINWQLIAEEAKNQVKLGKERVIFELGYFFEKMEEKFGKIVPKEVTDELWNLLGEKIEEKKNV